MSEQTQPDPASERRWGQAPDMKAHPVGFAVFLVVYGLVCYMIGSFGGELLY